MYGSNRILSQLRPPVSHTGAVHVWNCFITLMKTHGAAGAEQATWQADGHAPPAAPADGTNSNRGSEK
jgi:hypothetical protein